MTQEEKQLVLIELCTRLPYGLHVCIKEGKVSIDVDTVLRASDIHDWLTIPSCQNITFAPYLRPMSSMTEEEKNEVVKLGVCYDGAFHNDVYDVGTSMEEAFLAISWLIERHFDINYLINKGLALEAPEGMYD